MNTQREIEDNDFPTSGSGESSEPTIVLVHGALEDSSIWHGVIPRLQRDGYPVIVFSNPLLGVAVDAAYLRSVLDRIEGPVILVSHAYGGAVITQAGDDPKVKGLVYAASPMPAVGESSTRLERFPGGDFASSVDLTTYVGHNEFIAGKTFSVADIAAFTITQSVKSDLPWPKLPNLRRFFERIEGRPSVKRGLQARVRGP